MPSGLQGLLLAGKLLTVACVAALLVQLLHVSSNASGISPGARLLQLSAAPGRGAAASVGATARAAAAAAAEQHRQEQQQRAAGGEAPSRPASGRFNCSGAERRAEAAEAELAVLRTQQECLGWRAANEGFRRQINGWKLLADVYRATNASLEAGAAAGVNPASAAQELERSLLRGAAAALPLSLCSAVLRAKKAALLFLSLGPLPHERLWERWLAGAAGLLPLKAPPGQDCSPLATAFVGQVCGRGRGGTGSSGSSDGKGGGGGGGSGGPGVYVRQDLFSIYIHSRPDFDADAAFPPGSVFHGRTVRCRLPTSWGSHSTIDAMRMLLREALADPLNQRFVLVSETDIPMYSAPLVWAQLMSEERSRVKACDADPAWTDLYQRPSMMMDRGFLSLQDWRKSSQWFMLTREDAQLVVDDVEVDAVFRRHCYAAHDVYEQRERFCLSDEHYVATLLSARGRAPAPPCPPSLGGVSWALWQPGEPHPHTYSAEEVGPALLAGMRAGDGCDPAWADAALATHDAAFVAAEDWTPDVCAAVKAALQAESRGGGAGGGGDGGNGGSGEKASGSGGTGNGSAGGTSASSALPRFQPMPPDRCHLFARKFPAGATPAWLALTDQECGPAVARDGGPGYLGRWHCWLQGREERRRV